MVFPDTVHPVRLSNLLASQVYSTTKTDTNGQHKSHSAKREYRFPLAISDKRNIYSTDKIKLSVMLLRAELS